ncbi:hypothetical protein KY339_03335 [Candidatus Woesearchaeota archaeon]|nr:hypothetical protein [Candidatus Woesearchaeota archaeon]
MALAGKELGEYWEIIKIPLIIAVAVSVLGFLFNMVPVLGFVGVLLLGTAGWVVDIVLFAWVGWSTVKKHKGTIVNALVAGLLMGVIAGAIGGILGLISSLIFGGLLGFVVGIGAIFISLIWAGVIGGVVSLIAGLVAGGTTK